MMDNELWEQLNDEKGKVIEEYAKLKNRAKPFETEKEEKVRKDQIQKDEREKSEEFNNVEYSLGKKRDYILKLKEETEVLRMKERKYELEQKLKDQDITVKELLELQALNNILRVKE
jgi:hypothetical protein